MFLLWTRALLNQGCVTGPHCHIHGRGMKTYFAGLPESVVVAFLNHDRFERGLPIGMAHRNILIVKAKCDYCLSDV